MMKDLKFESIGRFAVAAVFLLSFFFVSGAWGECGYLQCYLSKGYSCESYPDACRSDIDQQVTAQCEGNLNGGMYQSSSLCGTYSGYCVGSLYDYEYGYRSVQGKLPVCQNEFEADSLLCVNQGNVWQNGECKEPCDAQCQCEESGGVWHPNGYCIKDCQSKACCDSMNVPQVDPDSIYIWENNSCVLHWKCDSTQTACNAKEWSLLAGVLQDTIETEGTTEIVNKCYFNCSKIIPSDSSKSMVEGNITLPTKSSTLNQGIKLPNNFNSIRSEVNGTYTYDFLSSQAEQYLDSIAFTPCTQTLYRCVLNNKYVYYYDNQTAPAGCTKTVKIK